jgi:hypothetical protein
MQFEWRVITDGELGEINSTGSSYQTVLSSYLCKVNTTLITSTLKITPCHADGLICIHRECRVFAMVLLSHLPWTLPMLCFTVAIKAYKKRFTKFPIPLASHYTLFITCSIRQKWSYKKNVSWMRFNSYLRWVYNRVVCCCCCCSVYTICIVSLL